MYDTYAVQQHKTNGCTYILRYGEVNTITGICGPLNQDEVESTNDPELMSVAPHLDYDTPTNPSGLDDNGFVEWHPPTAVYDPMNE